VTTLTWKIWRNQGIPKWQGKVRHRNEKVRKKSAETGKGFINVI